MDNGSWSCNLSVAAVNVNVPPEGQVQTKLEVGINQYDIDVIVIGKGSLAHSHGDVYCVSACITFR